MKTIIVIPARMGSSRFPGKPLALIAGKPMVQWVYKACCQVEGVSDIVVATPDEEIESAVKVFKGKSIRTSHSHTTGTDRVAEVAQKMGADVFINVQGDEPLIEAESIKTCIGAVTKTDVPVGSVYDWLLPEEEHDPSVVKVVTDFRDRALYFSRSSIPFQRSETSVPKKKHVGLYAYTKEALFSFAKWEPGTLERIEVLEQLRFLENGYRIQMAWAKGTPVAVDTPEQAKLAEDFISRRKIS
jgi:3-deoxy-manno-octulosonate cytidylyltransferase (CMP-KDO synthetase)